MRRHSPLVVAALATVFAACSSFSAADDHVAPDASVGPEDASGAPSTDSATSDHDAANDAANDAGADGAMALDCTGASFCDSFESGDLAAAATRWGAFESTGGGSGAVLTASERRFLHVSTAGTPQSYARLTHPIGPITSQTSIDLRFELRLMSSSESEIVAFNIFGAGSVLAADVTVNASTNGTLRVRWSQGGGGYTSSTPTATIDDAQWHAVKLHADAGGATLTVDTQTAVLVGGSPLAAYPECRLSAGAYLNSGAAAAVDLDDLRLDLH
jgi:hypothetical protein